MQASRILIIAPLYLCVFASACGDLSGPLNLPKRQTRKADQSRLLPLDPGVRVADADARLLAWSADGREVFYAVDKYVQYGRAYGIRAKSVLDSTAPERHIVDALDGRVVALASAPDPAWLYYIELRDPYTSPLDSLARFLLCRVSVDGGTPELIDVNALPEPASLSGMRPIIIAPDGSSIAYAARPIDQPDAVDSIFLFRSATGAKQSLPSAAGGRPLSFSPDGRRLLFERRLGQDSMGLFIADLAADSVWRVSDSFAGGPAAFAPWDMFFNWGPTGMLRIGTYNHDVFLENVEAGTRTQLVMDGYVGLDPLYIAAGWAPDGSPVVWKIGCQNMSGDWCLARRTALYGFDTSGGSPRVLAVINDPEVHVPVAFSPDGLRVAYIAKVWPGLFAHDVR